MGQHNMSIKEKVLSTHPWFLVPIHDKYEVKNKETNESGGLYDTKDEAKRVAKKLAGLKDK